ncbi:MAG: 16S rRNA (cytosine(1402)-N(4))-methyltransferase RsmH [Chitinophagales bacterium]
MKKDKPNERFHSEQEEKAAAYHIPVLLHECLEGLQLQPDGTYADATFGGGGHSREILKHLGAQGRLLGFDQDADALANAIEDDRFTAVNSNFSQIKKFLRLHGVQQLDGLLADLGVSSFQFDTPHRGFSFRFDGPLDMRMNVRAATTAAMVLNEFPAARLQEVLGSYGEVRNAKTLAAAIVAQRKVREFRRTADLVQLLEQHAIGEKHKYFAQVFQALRIEVNGELDALKALLLQSEEIIKTGGRLCVITFHSLEDRLVKNYMKHGNFSDEPEKDAFGKTERKWKLITKKPIVAGDSEQKENSRSRSAKLRVAERT